MPKARPMMHHLVRPLGPRWRPTRQPGIGSCAACPTGSYMQLTAWAEVKAVNGWRRITTRAEGPDWLIGAQLLVHPIGRTPWSIGYAPRGPVAQVMTPGALAEWTDVVRQLAVQDRLSHVTIEPQVPAGEGFEAALEAAGWRRARTVQDPRTRVIDLERPEADVWSDLRSKWRQYVNKARRDGVAIVEVGEEGIPDFHRIYVETAQRAGFVHRAESAYRDVLPCLRSAGRGTAPLRPAAGR